MQFVIDFKSSNGDEISGTFPHGFGLDMVKQIRAEAECPELDLKWIQGIIYPLSLQMVRVNVEEDYADRSGRFRYEEAISVVVPLAGLRGFFIQKTIIRRNPACGTATAASVEWRLDEEAILAAWAADGCPLFWDTDN